MHLQGRGRWRKRHGSLCKAMNKRTGKEFYQSPHSPENPALVRSSLPAAPAGNHLTKGLKANPASRSAIQGPSHPQRERPGRGSHPSRAPRPLRHPPSSSTRRAKFEACDPGRPSRACAHLPAVGSVPRHQDNEAHWRFTHSNHTQQSKADRDRQRQTVRQRQGESGGGGERERDRKGVGAKGRMKGGGEREKEGPRVPMKTKNFADRNAKWCSQLGKHSRTTLKD